MGDHGFVIQVLDEASTMLDYQLVQVIETGLGISVDMDDNAFEYLGVILGLRLQLDIEILELDFLSSEVVAEATKR